METLAEGILKKDIRAAAKLMRLIESENIEAIAHLKKLYPHTGNSHVVGITGLPGAGKSSIINEIIENYRNKGKTVGVIAIDPSSPFSGGSLLGDRIRMQKHADDRGVYIRSLPTRGWKGGVSKVTSLIITVMDAMGKDIVLVETAGVGQTEVEIKKMVHSTVLVLVGGLGDSIQCIKAGILEIADIFVINKAKNNGEARNLELDLQNLIGLGKYENDWKPAIFLTDILDKTGIDPLIRGIEKHKAYLESNKLFSAYFRQKAEQDLKNVISEYVTRFVLERIEDKNILEKVSRIFEEKGTNPTEASKKIIKEILNLKTG